MRRRLFLESTNIVYSIGVRQFTLIKERGSKMIISTFYILLASILLWVDVQKKSRMLGDVPACSSSNRINFRLKIMPEKPP